MKQPWELRYSGFTSCLVCCIIKELEELSKNRQYAFVESGFYKYVQSKSKKLPGNNEKKQIVTGKQTDSITAGRCYGRI